MRASVFDGKYYKRNFEELDNQIRESFSSDFGPGELPIKRGEGLVNGIIVPNSFYSIAGPCSAWAYKRLGEASFAEVYVVVGTNSSSFGNMISSENWSTPFGKVSVDEGFGKLLLNSLSFVHVNDIAHKKEFNIEVQLPFLQFVSKDKLHDLKVLPLILSKDSDYERLRDMGRIIGESERNICVIAISNLSHRKKFDSLDVEVDARLAAKQLDKGAIRLIENMDSKGFYDYATGKGLSFDGIGPIVVAIEACKLLGSRSSKLLRHYSSREINNNFDEVINFGSFIFE